MAKQVALKKRVDDENLLYAEKNKEIFARHKVLGINLMAAPGAGKTSLIESAARELGPHARMGVIEGDLAGNIDRDRLSAQNIPVVQINTGSGCHLNAEQVNQVIEKLPLDQLDYVVIENIGNLVCPAGIPLGETLNLVLLSITEGDDKPIKYPVMFYHADCVLINKLDLQETLQVDLLKIKNAVHCLKSDLPVFEISAKTGEGVKPWINWLKKQKGK